jgi:hypothetical protein
MIRSSISILSAALCLACCAPSSNLRKANPQEAAAVALDSLKAQSAKRPTDTLYARLEIYDSSLMVYTVYELAAGQDYAWATAGWAYPKKVGKPRLWGIFKLPDTYEPQIKSVQLLAYSPIWELAASMPRYSWPETDTCQAFSSATYIKDNSASTSTCCSNDLSSSCAYINDLEAFFESSFFYQKPDLPIYKD